jgi:hypothetical protein
MAEKWYGVTVNGSHETTMKTQYKATIWGAYASKDGDVKVVPVYVLTAKEWAKFQALYRVAESIHSSRDRESFGYISDLEEAIDAIDGGTYNPEIAEDTNADV